METIQRDKVRKIEYKGATITISPTTKAYRGAAEIFRNINFFVTVENAGVGMMKDFPSCDLAKTLAHARKRILKARRHPEFGW